MHARLRELTVAVGVMEVNVCVHVSGYMRKCVLVYMCVIPCVYECMVVCVVVSVCVCVCQVFECCSASTNVLVGLHLRVHLVSSIQLHI